MKKLQLFRIVLAILFLVASIGYALLGNRFPALAFYSQKLQIIPSLFASTIGITIFWFTATLLFGRIYCSTVCPIGTIIDGATFIRKRYLPMPTFRYKKAFRHRYDALVIYIVCLVINIVAVCLILQPWDIFANIMATFHHPSAATAEWTRIGVSMGTAVAIGIAELILLAASGIFFGRDFCNLICPIGNAMALLNSRTLFHIEINPDKCIGCLKCEEQCNASCIKVISRYVDNSRCVRCFDCINACPNNAICYQLNRNRPATPLFTKTVNQSK